MEIAEGEGSTGSWSVASRVGANLLGMLVLAGFSLGVGGLINLLRPDPLPWVYEGRAQAMDRAVTQLRGRSSQPEFAVASAELPREIRLEEFERFVREHPGMVLDARPAVFYRAAHVPGALNLPRETFVATYQALRSTLEASKERPVVIYCSGADCPDSQLVSDALTKLGYQHLLIYTSGWEEWSQTGLPQEGENPSP